MTGCAAYRFPAGCDRVPASQAAAVYKFSTAEALNQSAAVSHGNHEGHRSKKPRSRAGEGPCHGGMTRWRTSANEPPTPDLSPGYQAQQQWGMHIPAAMLPAPRKRASDAKALMASRWIVGSSIAPCSLVGWKAYRLQVICRGQLHPLETMHIDSCDSGPVPLVRVPAILNMTVDDQLQSHRPFRCRQAGSPCRVHPRALDEARSWSRVCGSAHRGATTTASTSCATGPVFDVSHIRLE